MLCVSGSSIWANGVEVLQYSRPYPRSIPTARKYPAVTVNRGSTALAVANPPINVSVADDGGVDGQIKARVENQAFGYAEAYLHTGDFISVDVDDRRFRLVLSGLTAAAALFTPFEAGSSAGFLRFEHIAVLGTVRTGILLYAVADDDGSQRLGVGARFNPDATLQWLSGAPDVALPRISGTLGIRGLRDGLNVQIDDHVGTYLLPIDYRITSYSGYFAASGIWVPAVQYTSLSAAAATYLQGTLKGRGSPGSVAVARQWQCQ